MSKPGCQYLAFLALASGLVAVTEGLSYNRELDNVTLSLPNGTAVTVWPQVGPSGDALSPSGARKQLEPGPFGPHTQLTEYETRTSSC